MGPRPHTQKRPQEPFINSSCRSHLCDWWGLRWNNQWRPCRVHWDAKAYWQETVLVDHLERRFTLSPYECHRCPSKKQDSNPGWPRPQKGSSEWLRHLRPAKQKDWVHTGYWAGHLFCLRELDLAHWRVKVRDAWVGQKRLAAHLESTDWARWQRQLQDDSLNQKLR